MDVTTALYVSGIHLVLLYIILYSYSDPGRIQVWQEYRY